MVSIGVMDENNLESPILSWQDPRPHNTPLDSLGLTALGSGVFFKYRDGKKGGNLLRDFASVARTRFHAT